MLRWLLESFNLFRQEKHRGKKNTGKLEGFALCHGESTGAPEKQGPYEGTMVVFSSLDKALFPWGAWQGRFFGSKAPQK